uniref:Cytochrome P450 89A2 n=1 Tax=Triticum urartu TaxID=4572 RepID=A0A8R7UN23_TRIUA
MRDLLTLSLILMMLLVVVFMVVRRHSSSLASSIKSALARRLRQPAIVIKDRATAHRLLVRGCVGGSFSNRPASLAPTAVVSHLRHHNLTTAPYGPFWRVTRRNLTPEVLHPLRLHSYAAARRDALAGLVADLGEQCTTSPDGLVLAAESIRNAMFGLLATMCFGEGVDKGLVRAMADAHEFVQFFPELRFFAKLPAVARMIYRKRWSKLVALRQKQEDMYLPLIHTRRTRQRQSGELPAYVDTLIDLWVQDEHNAYDGNVRKRRRRQRRLADGEIVGMCAEFVGAGTETVAAELQWANLVKRPHVQEAVRREIDDAVNMDTEEVGEEVLGKLEYLNAVVLEVLRLHPTVTLVVRQVSEEDDIIHDGRRIPSGTNVLFRPESLARDKTAWANPDDFRPERFLPRRGGESVNLVAAAGSSGGEMRMLPFGAGRRVCPGMGVAMLHMGYFMSNLVKEFEWREAEGELAVDLRPHFGFFTVMKRPLRARLFAYKRPKG